MFERLADTIVKHPKKIVVLWIVLLLIASPFAAKVLTDPTGIFSYDMAEMSGDSESVRGLEIISDSDYFNSDDSSLSNILVIECDSEEQLKTIEGTDDEDGFLTSLESKLQEHYGLDNEGEQRVLVVSAGYQSKDGSYPGVVLFAIVFTDKTIDSGEEVVPLRTMISEVIADGSLGLTTYLTGYAAIYHDTEVGSMEDIKRIDPFTIALIFILIGLFFRSFVSAMAPPLTIGFAYGIVLMALFFLASVMDIYYITSTIILVSMMGAGCDYCIFIIARYREERVGGRSHSDAIKEAVKWAGESVAISGCSVIIGFGIMAFCSFSMVSTMGIAMALGIVFALIAALTFIPAVLMIVGEKIFWPSKIETYLPGSKAMNGWYGKVSKFGRNYFTKSAHFSIKHAWAIVIVALIATAPLAYVTVTHSASYDMIATMPDGESKQGMDVMTEFSDGGMVMPTYVVLDTNQEIANVIPDAISKTVTIDGEEKEFTFGALKWESDDLRDLYVGYSDTLVDSIMNGETITGVSDVTGILSWDLLVEEYGDDAINQVSSSYRDPIQEILDIDDMAWTFLTDGKYEKSHVIDYIINYVTGNISVYYNSCQYIRLSVIVASEPMSEEAMGNINPIREIVKENIAEFDAAQPMSNLENSSSFYNFWVTGTGVVIYDISQVVNDEFILIEIAVMALIAIMLFFVMKSYTMPIRAVATIVMSIIWTLGLTFIIFSEVMGVPVIWIMPIMLFVICLGLGMDYDILLTTRIKENVSKGMSNDESIIHAVEKSGAVITICGLIMSGAFATMTLSTSPMLQEFGFALGFAIFVDALIVRTYIVPAVMHLLGKWNWEHPAFMDKMYGRT